MRLGIYHEPVHTDGQTFDTYGAYARYVLEFAKHFDHVTVFAPVTSKTTYFSGCPLERQNLTVVPLPYFETHAQAYRHAVTIARIFRTNAGALDVINCRGTAPLAYLLWWFTRRRKVPFIYHFAADPFEVLDRSPVYRGIYGRFARFAYGIEFSVQKYIMRRNYSFTSGNAIYERFRQITPNIEPLVTSSLLNEDYYLRKDCCTADELRLLYVGRLKAGKGLEYLIQAVNILRSSGSNPKLDIVGEGDQIASLSQLARELKVSDGVHFHGFVVMGPALNQYYNSADVFIYPSLSEGSPKSVLEALGHSLPVIATPVGNVPEMLDNGQRGILVPLRDPQAIAQAVIRLVEDSAHRRVCIQEGYAFAKEHSVERFVGRMADKARSLAKERQRGTAG
jgi:glycosyltransferase involved in cell wall biosynthesis